MRKTAIILPRGTAEELMTTRFDLQLTNQKKGPFNSRPHVEIENSIFLLIFLPFDEKLRLILYFCFLNFFFKNELFSTLNIKTKSA